jgi:beta-glucosidase
MGMVLLAGVCVRADEKTNPPAAADSESIVIPPELQPVTPVYDKRYRGRHDELVVQARTQPIEVALYGDSLTQNFGGEIASRQIWDREMAPLKAGNFGISGNKVENLLWRVQNGELETMKLKVAVVMIGTNNLGGVSKAVAEGIKLILQTIAMSQPQARILLLGIPPAGWNATDGTRSSAREINALLADFKKQNLCDAYLDWGGVLLEPDGSLSHQLSTDGWHYTPAGYEAYVKAVKPVLLQCLAMPPKKEAGVPRPEK